MCTTEIIVPTLASEDRASQLRRAIESITSQGARALVVVNGARFDTALVAELGQREDIRLLCIPEPGLPNAIHVGRCSVECDYFGILDDDDYLLPGCIVVRESYLDSHPEIDVVITNGLREEWGDEPRMYKDRGVLQRIVDDPLGSLLQRNWLTPCGALYRASTIGEDVFFDLSKYAEWTDMAYRLIDDYHYSFLLDETFVQADSPGSLSKQAGQASYLLKLHEGFSGKVQTARQRRLLRRRLSDLHHAMVEYEMGVGNRSSAFSHHLKSMLIAPLTGIPRYLLFTRKLILRQSD